MGIQPYDENDQPTRTIQLDRPLDFTAVTDHSEFHGRGAHLHHRAACPATGTQSVYCPPSLPRNSLC